MNAASQNQIAWTVYRAKGDANRVANGHPTRVAWADGRTRTYYGDYEPPAGVPFVPAVKFDELYGAR
jgi:hypothetical protein